jgi:dephospho-CoA kinase
MNEVIIINGYNGSGKDEFVNMFPNKRVINYSTIDYYKIVLENKFGWDGEKNEKSREALSRLKEFDRWFRDGPFVDTCKFIEIFKKANADFIFIHSREPEEIKRLKKRYNAITLLIDRTSVKPANNKSDMSVKMMGYDYVVENNGTKDDLKHKAEIFYDWITENKFTIGCESMNKIEDEINRLLAEMQLEINELVTALHDTICRPMGVVPDSALRFYSKNEADKAQERCNNG